MTTIFLIDETFKVFKSTELLKSAADYCKKTGLPNCEPLVPKYPRTQGTMRQMMTERADWGLRTAAARGKKNSLVIVEGQFFLYDSEMPGAHSEAFLNCWMTQQTLFGKSLQFISYFAIGYGRTGSILHFEQRVTRTAPNRFVTDEWSLLWSKVRPLAWQEVEDALGAFIKIESLFKVPDEPAARKRIDSLM